MGQDSGRHDPVDFGGTVLGRPIAVDARNDHNKPDLVAALAEDAYDKGADLLMDVQDSPIAVAASKVAAARHRLAIVTLAASPAITRAACNRHTWHYSFDAPAIVAATAASVAGLPDGRRWVAIVADAGFGKGAVAAIAAEGGEIVKSMLLPVGAPDLAPALKEAEGLEPDVGGVFSAGADAGRKVAAGVKAHVATARAWADRFAAAHGGLRPTAAQAADYSATTRWLEAVEAAGTTDADAVNKVLEGHAFEDVFARDAQWRASDHMVVHDLYVVDVLPQAQVFEPHAWFKVVATVPAARAFPEQAAGTCRM